MQMNLRRSTTESPRRCLEVRPYYASPRRFTPASGWLLPGNLGGIADRLLMAGHGSSGGATERPVHSPQRPSRHEGRLSATEPPVGAAVPMGVNDPLLPFVSRISGRS